MLLFFANLNFILYTFSFMFLNFLILYFKFLFSYFYIVLYLYGRLLCLVIFCRRNRPLCLKFRQYSLQRGVPVKVYQAVLFCCHFFCFIWYQSQFFAFDAERNCGLLCTSKSVHKLPPLHHLDRMITIHEIFRL